MRNKRALVFFCCIGLLVVLCIEAFRELSLRSRAIQNEMILLSLSTGVEMYRECIGIYPSSLSQICSNSSLSKEMTEVLRQSVSVSQTNVWKDVYTFDLLSNGFRLTITGPDVAPLGWLGRSRKIERSYAPGQALQPQ
jgi:hypothetical protein